MTLNPPLFTLHRAKMPLVHLPKRRYRKHSRLAEPEITVNSEELYKYIKTLLITEYWQCFNITLKNKVIRQIFPWAHYSSLSAAFSSELSSTCILFTLLISSRESFGGCRQLCSCCCWVKLFISCCCTFIGCLIMLEKCCCLAKLLFCWEKKYATHGGCWNKCWTGCCSSPWVGKLLMFEIMHVFRGRTPLALFWESVLTPWPPVGSCLLSFGGGDFGLIFSISAVVPVKWPVEEWLK